MSITVDKLNAAIQEAERFILAAEIVREVSGINRGTSTYDSGKHTAAVKRASMDLSRALSDLRRGYGK